MIERCPKPCGLADERPLTTLQFCHIHRDQDRSALRGAGPADRQPPVSGKAHHAVGCGGGCQVLAKLRRGSGPGPGRKGIAHQFDDQRVVDAGAGPDPV